MSNEVAPLVSVQEKITGKIKADFVDLMPDEVWENLVQSVMKDFIEDKPPQYSGHPKIESPAKKMIREAIEVEFKAQIKAELLNMQSEWDGTGKKVLTEATKKLLSEHMGDFIQAMQAGATQYMVEQVMIKMKESMGQY